MRWFEDVEIWRKTLGIARETYELTGHELFSRNWRYRDQFRRCALSVMSNIADGFDKTRSRDVARLLARAEGSCGDLREHLKTAYAGRFIELDDYFQLVVRTNRLGEQLTSLIGTLRRF